MSSYAGKSARPTYPQFFQDHATKPAPAFCLAVITRLLFVLRSPVLLWRCLQDREKWNVFLYPVQSSDFSTALGTLISAKYAAG